MSIRADFYIGVGSDAEWLGSVGFDGNQFWADYADPISTAETELAFRSAVAELKSRSDFTEPSMGWPWPWDDSSKTDFVYSFHQGYVQVFWENKNVEVTGEQYPRWPNMSRIRKLPFGNRSGLKFIKKEG